MNKNILILGHTGFLGKNLVKFLQEKNYNNLYKISKENCDLRDYNQLCNFLKTIPKIDIIFNCAANVGSVHYVTKYAGDVIHDNSLITLNIYKSILEYFPNATIVNPFSNCCYVDGKEIQQEENWLKGEVHPSVFSFGNFKRFLYYTSKCYNIQHKIKSINYYNDEFEIWGTGTPIREWTYVDDACEVMVKSLSLKDEIIEPVNVAQGTGFSIAETAKCISNSIGYKGKLTFNTKYQDGAAIKILGDKNFKKIFNNYIFFDHQKGIDETVKYYKLII